MPDRISNYRQVRLIVSPTPVGGGPAHWALHAVVVRRGVPTARALAGGDLYGLADDCSEEEIWAALAWIVNRNYRSPNE